MADFDFSGLQGILGQFQPSDEDKRRALTQALASAGFGILGARNVNGWQALGQGGLMGINSYNGALDEASQGRQRAMQNAMGAMQLQEGMQKFQDQDAFRKLQETIAARYPLTNIPGMPQAGVSPNTAAQFGPADQAANAGMSGNAAPVAVPTDGLARKRAQADAYRQQAAAYAQSANPMAQAMAQQLMDKADKILPQIKETRTLTQNGKRVVVNFYNDGTHEILPDVGPDAEKAVQIDTGGKIIAADPYNLQPLTGGGAFTKEMTPGERASNAVAWANNAETKRRNDINEGDPAQIESLAQLIAAGKMPPPSGFAAARPVSQAIMARVAQINPEYSAIDYNTGKKAEADFATGKNGNTVRSLNVAISHLDTLGNLADALKNGNVQLFNKASQTIAQQTGNPAPTNFDAAKKVVADEIVKAIVGSGGGVADREEAAAAISRANSPAQLRGVINTYTTLMGGQLHGLQQQYETNTKRKDFNRFLSPETQRLLTSLSAGSDVRSQADKILSGG